MLSKIAKDAEVQFDESEIPSLSQMFSWHFDGKSEVTEEKIIGAAHDWWADREMFDDCSKDELIEFLSDLNVLYLEYNNHPVDIYTSRHNFFDRTLGPIMVICVEKLQGKINELSAQDVCDVMLFASRCDILDRPTGATIFASFAERLVDLGVTKMNDSNLSLFVRAIPRVMLSNDIVEQSGLAVIFGELKKRVVNLHPRRQVFCLFGLSKLQTENDEINVARNAMCTVLIDKVNANAIHLSTIHKKLLRHMPLDIMTRLSDRMRRYIGDIRVHVAGMTAEIGANKVFPHYRGVVDNFIAAFNSDDPTASFRTVFNISAFILGLQEAYTMISSSTLKGKFSDYITQKLLPVLISKKDDILKTWDADVITGFFNVFRVLQIKFPCKGPFFEFSKALLARMIEDIRQQPYYNTFKLFHFKNNLPETLQSNDLDALIDEKFQKVIQYRTTNIEDALELLCDLVDLRTSACNRKDDSLKAEAGKRIKQLIPKINKLAAQYNALDLADDIKYPTIRSVVYLPKDARELLDQSFLQKLGFRHQSTLFNPFCPAVAQWILKMDHATKLSHFFTPGKYNEIITAINREKGDYPEDKREIYLDFPQDFRRHALVMLARNDNAKNNIVMITVT